MSLHEGRLPAGYAREIRGHNEGQGKNVAKKRSRTYQSYYNMLARCYLKYVGDNSNHCYKAAGILVCKEWIDGGFHAFLRDMGERPAGTSLDRIDPEKSYTPDNCRWATPSQQSRNQRRFKRRPRGFFGTQAVAS